MDLELLISLAARLRELSEDEFFALQVLIKDGIEDAPLLPAVAQALADLIDISKEHDDWVSGRTKMRLAR